MSYTLIQTVTLTSNQASISFNSIPATFDDLKLVFSARGTITDTQDVFLQFNGDTAGNYSFRRLFGTGSAVASDSVANAATAFRVGRSAGTNRTASTFSNCEVYIPNYRSTVAKSASSDQVDENNATEAFQLMTACLYNGTSAITSIVMQTLGGSNFATGTSASLYGITRGSSGGVVVS